MVSIAEGLVSQRLWCGFLADKGVVSYRPRGGILTERGASCLHRVGFIEGRGGSWRVVGWLPSGQGVVSIAERVVSQLLWCGFLADKGVVSYKPKGGFLSEKGGFLSAQGRFLRMQWWFMASWWVVTERPGGGSHCRKGGTPAVVGWFPCRSGVASYRPRGGFLTEKGGFLTTQCRFLSKQVWFPLRGGWFPNGYGVVSWQRGGRFL